MKFLAIIPVLAQLALAAPAPAPVGTGELIFPEGFNSTGLEKRQGDGSGIHLVNCNGFSGEGGVSPKQSFVLVSSFNLSPRIRTISSCRRVANIAPVLRQRQRLQQVPGHEQRVQNDDQRLLHLGGGCPGLHVPHGRQVPVVDPP